MSQTFTMQVHKARTFSEKDAEQATYRENDTFLLCRFRHFEITFLRSLSSVYFLVCYN